MRKSLFSLHLFFAIPALYAQSGKMVITNESGVSMTAEPVTLSRSSVAEFVDIPSSESKWLSIRIKGKEIPSQLDDLDRDGQWDELAFQIDIERNSTLELKLKWVEKSEQPIFPKRVEAFLGVSDNQNGKFESRQMEICPENRVAREQPPRYHMEGPVWENEQVGFRYFLDPRNRPDVFGKRKPKLILDSIGLTNTHFGKPQPWGMQILNSEGSLGAGGVGLLEKGEVLPIRKSEPTQFVLLSDGPCRAMFDLIFENWDINGAKYQLRQRISIWAGKYWYKNELLLSGFTGTRTLVVGMGGEKIQNQAVYKSLSANFATIYCHDQLSENKDFLGLAILFPSKVFDGYGETPSYKPFPTGDDSLSNSQFVQLKAKSGQPIEVLVFAAWEKSDVKFSNTRYFLDIVQEEADKKEVVLKFASK